MNEKVDPEILESWSRDATEVAKSLGSVLLGDEKLLLREFTFGLSESERTFEPTPIVRPTEEGLSMICNINSYHEWEKVFGESPVLNDEQVKKMYLATGLAWVELIVLANIGIKQREFVDSQHVTKAQSRAHMLMSEIDSREKLASEASKVSEMGIDGVVECIYGLTTDEIKNINKYRYGIAVALQVAGLSEAEKDNLQKDLLKQLVSGVQNYKKGLYAFLTNFVLPDEAHQNTEKSFRKGFPYLLFASTFPMNVSHINSQ
jgi:hypothetical protein